MYEKITLPNGARIVSDYMEGVRSAAVGIWVGCGSRFEGRNENGAAHFIEHMLFKGTKNHTASGLAEAMDSIGGQINACTTRESTCFYARVLDTHLDTAIDILSDMFFDSLFREEDFQGEMGVVLGEIGMYNDAPDDLAAERLLKKAFPGPLGRPILGTPASLGKGNAESLKSFKLGKYTAPNVIIALAGNFGDGHVGRVEKRFGQMEKGDVPKPKKAEYVPGLISKLKATEQEHICIGFPGIQTGRDERFALNMLSSMLGGGMSSRLFQSVRERSGLCYSIDSFGEAFAETGMFGVETAVSRDTAEKALRLIVREIRDFRDKGFSEAELQRAREQAKASLVMAQESTIARMNRLGFAELTTGNCLSTGELIERCDAVTAEDIKKLSARILDFDRSSFSSVGRASYADIYKKILEE